MKWEETTSNNFTWDEMSALQHFELTTKQLNEICDQLVRNELIVPQGITNELSSALAGFDEIKSTSITTLPDFIHIAGIFCRLYANSPEGNSAIPRLIIVADELLQFYLSKKSS